MTSQIKSLKNITNLAIASSSNGRTADSDSVNLGSNPGEAAINKKPFRKERFFIYGVAPSDENLGLERVVGEHDLKKCEAYGAELFPAKWTLA